MKSSPDSSPASTREAIDKITTRLYEVYQRFGNVNVAMNNFSNRLNQIAELAGRLSASLMLMVGLPRVMRSDLTHTLMGGSKVSTSGYRGSSGGVGGGGGSGSSFPTKEERFREWVQIEEWKANYRASNRKGGKEFDPEESKAQHRAWLEEKNRMKLEADEKYYRAKSELWTRLKGEREDLVNDAGPTIDSHGNVVKAQFPKTEARREHDYNHAKKRAEEFEKLIKEQEAEHVAQQAIVNRYERYQKGDLNDKAVSVQAALQFQTKFKTKPFNYEIFKEFYKDIEEVRSKVLASVPPNLSSGDRKDFLDQNLTKGLTDWAHLNQNKYKDLLDKAKPDKAPDMADLEQKIIHNKELLAQFQDMMKKNEPSSSSHTSSMGGPVSENHDAHVQAWNKRFEDYSSKGDSSRSMMDRLNDWQFGNKMASGYEGHINNTHPLPPTLLERLNRTTHVTPLGNTIPMTNTMRVVEVVKTLYEELPKSFKKGWDSIPPINWGGGKSGGAEGGKDKKATQGIETVFLGLTAALSGLVRAASPDTFATFTGSIQLLAGSIGSTLIPYFVQLSGIIQGLAFKFQGLDNTSKELIGKLLIGATAFTGLFVVVRTFSSMLTLANLKLGLMAAGIALLIDQIHSYSNLQRQVKSRDEARDRYKNAPFTQEELLEIEPSGGGSKIIKLANDFLKDEAKKGTPREKAKGEVFNYLDKYLEIEKKRLADAQSVMKDLPSTGVFGLLGSGNAGKVGAEYQNLWKKVFGESMPQGITQEEAQKKLADKKDVIAEQERRVRGIETYREALRKGEKLPHGDIPSLKMEQTREGREDKLRNILYNFQSLKVQPRYSGIEEAYKNIQVEALSKTPLEQALDTMVRQNLLKMIEASGEQNGLLKSIRDALIGAGR